MAATRRRWLKEKHFFFFFLLLLSRGLYILSLNNFNIEGNQCLRSTCITKRSKENVTNVVWKRGSGKVGWKTTTMVGQSLCLPLLPNLYIYIYFSLTCISRFCLQKLVTDFSRNTAFRKKTLLNYLFFFFAKTFLSTGNSPRYERPRDASQFARHFSRLIRYKIPIIIPRDLERRKSACKRQSYLRDKFSIICQIILL